MNVLVTGARGFIGSAFIRNVVANKTFKNVTAFVRDTNSWSQARLPPADNKGFRIATGDLNGDISGLCEKVDVVFNFAAKTFVDHSLRDPHPFISTNVVGTANLLEEARKQKVKAFFQVSTDEVYGQILKGAHNEQSPINPRNPYAASKAGADALVISYAHSFGMWTCVTRTENNYGPFQHPQKAMPLFIGKAFSGELLPVYGDGQHVRQWLHVEDHVSALLRLCQYGYECGKAEPGEVFHVAGNQELTNESLAKRILDLMGRSHNLIKFIPDHDIRPGHDKRYALSCDKMRDRLGWEPAVGLDAGLEATVDWYRRNWEWLSVV